MPVKARYFAYIGGVSLLCGAFYNLVTLHDHSAALSLAGQGFAALGIGKGLAVTHDKLDEAAGKGPDSK